MLAWVLVQSAGVESAESARIRLSADDMPNREVHVDLMAASRRAGVHAPAYPALQSKLEVSHNSSGHVNSSASHSNVTDNSSATVANASAAAVLGEDHVVMENRSALSRHVNAPTEFRPVQTVRSKQ